MARPRHPKPALEKVLKDGETQGWRVTRDGKYFKMWCPCPEKHIKTVRLSPSGARYETNLRSKLLNSTCWKEVGR